MAETCGMKRATFTVETDAILREVASMCRHRDGSPIAGAWMGISMIKAGLAQIAQRAIELDDPQLLSICEQMCLIRENEHQPRENSNDR